MELEELQNEVLRKIGRNVLNFQQLEALLKASIVRSQVQSDARDLKSILEQRERSVSTRTMGDLVGEHLRGIYGEPKGTSTPSTPEGMPTYAELLLQIGADALAAARKRIDAVPLR